ncbi:GNAT family N-acetyltransferase [Hymenobacter siberiensis]|uniref:GNAT family N-acetyltransferase n=1 Tax=Hymenobacter siberiensis TaxID=2848396 RepID=UPI001C1E14B9|nr:GNAT family N-acetyltransferase [Hymenobacter siberiensis]
MTLILRPVTLAARLPLGRLLPALRLRPRRGRAAGAGRIVGVAHPEWGALYLLDDAGQAVGYAGITYFTFERGGRYALVDELYMAGAARSRGVGRAALLLLQQQARAAGLVALYLQTEPYNARAQRLYESVGFVDDERRNLAWLSGAVPGKE